MHSRLSNLVCVSPPQLILIFGDSCSFMKWLNNVASNHGRPGTSQRRQSDKIVSTSCGQETPIG
eukprot:m.163182 g.163182  ORF g.163182 m.163182 type:complete len:64 (+) comp38849_c0_seq15:1258-1449(+)